MKILVEIPDEAIEKDDAEEEAILNTIESGIYYMARVGGDYNIAESDIRVSKLILENFKPTN